MTQQSAASRAEVRRATKAAKLFDQQRREVLVGLLSTPAGRSYLWDQLEWSHIFSSTYDDLHTRMAFLEGQRSAGLRLLSDIMSAAPDQFILAMREANERRTSEQPGSSNGNGRDQGSDADSDGDENGANAVNYGPGYYEGYRDPEAG